MNGTATKDYDYELPKELIAQTPLPERDASRLMVVDRETGTTSEHVFKEIVSLLDAKDCLVLNDTRVIPARLLGARENGSAAEVLLLKRLRTDAWECLVRPGKKLKKGAKVFFGEGILTGTVEEVLPDGNRVVGFSWEASKYESFEEVLDALGEMPLPPYITEHLSERERYQTVYAKYEGSAAAPTAGLHFTPALLEEIRAKGCATAFVTLHVGLGTFRPVKVEDVTEHVMHSEWYRVTEECASLINARAAAGGRIICIGTTSCRTIETVSDDAGIVHPGEGDTSIFIYPGYRFKRTDGLVTNFHLPQSTLLMLVSAFAGREHVLHAYEEAVREKYRFFSFGDAMFIN